MKPLTIDVFLYYAFLTLHDCSLELSAAFTMTMRAEAVDAIYPVRNAPTIIAAFPQGTLPLFRQV